MDELTEWRRAATEYLEWWCSTDRRLISEFSTEITCPKLADMFSPAKYKVACTVPGYGPGKYASLARELNSLRQVVATEENVPTVIEALCFKMSNEYGKFIPSAISKALWMMKGHPVAVYERLAKGGLRRVGFTFNDLYHGYFTAWLALFKRSDTQQALVNAAAWLPGSPVAEGLIRTRRITQEELNQLVASPRFGNRTLDVWLMNKALA